MKQLITKKLLLLAAVLLAGVGSASAFEVDGLTYRVIDNNAKTVKVSYQGNDIMYSTPYTQSSIVIPETVSLNGNTYRVVEIGDNAFQNAAMSSITIPATVKTIGGSAFMNCQNLKSVDLSGIENFGTHIFSTCTSLKTVKLPETLHSIPDAMFSMCSSITSFSFDNISSIGYSSFEGTGLTSVTLSCTNIGMNAFANCKQLTKITMLGNYLSMIDNQFWGCDNVKTFICFLRITGNFGFPDDVKESARVIVPESQVSNWTSTFLNVEVANINNVGGHVIDVPGGAYYMDANYMGQVSGNITINGKTADAMYGQAFVIEPGSNVEIGFTPNSNLAWKLSTATINGTDVTSSLVDGKYTINSISGNQLVKATWEQGSQGSQGDTYDVTYYASDYSCGTLFINNTELSMYSNTAAFPANQNINVVIKPNSGYSISYFRIDAFDRTNELTANADGSYSYTHYLYGSTSVEVGYEKTGGSVIPTTYEYVDLGLPSGTKWATMNVGATSLSDEGDFFAWGETTTKAEYTSSNYIFGSGSSMTKYNNSDNLLVLQPEDDAATVKWGEGWRTPTIEEWEELNNKCTKTYTSVNGVGGYLFTGTNGNTIFLPGQQENLWGNVWGSYWSSSVNASDKQYAWNIDFDGGGFYIDEYNDRSMKGNIRPVREGNLVIPTEQCATPTITYADGQLQFECETEGAECHYKITSSDISEGIGNLVPLSATYHISVYATKSGYLDSDTATYQVEWTKQAGIRGDTNGDGVVDVEDVVETVNIILEQ